MLYYVPLEPYPSRYTMQWSAANTGWLERNWLKHHVVYYRVEGEKWNEALGCGRVLNPITRAKWAFAQTNRLLELLDTGAIRDDDVIYFDDFWHPGLEQLKYGMELMGIRPKLAAFCHAQSVDKWDFTRPMAQWMRPIEIGYSRIYDYIFVNNPILQEMMENINPEQPGKVRCTGHVFDSEEVRERAGYDKVNLNEYKEPRIVYSSRLDSEKNPHLFLNIVERFTEQKSPYNIKFVLCSGTELRSNVAGVVGRARELARRRFSLLEIKENLTKEQYYDELLKAHYHISTSRQDWISFCLLEAVTLGCYPMYPCYRSFPEAFGKFSTHLYSYSELDGSDPADICDYIEDTIFVNNNNIGAGMRYEMFEEIVKPHDSTWKRMLNIMGVDFSGVELEI